MKKILLKPFEGLATVWSRLSDFQQACWRLTGLYLFVLLVLLNLFTGSLFLIFQQEERHYAKTIKIEWREQKLLFPDNKEITILELKKQPQASKEEYLLELQHSFLQTIKQWVLVIEFWLIVLGGFLSYFLAKKTLDPIQKKNEQQKQFLADVSHELKNPLAALKVTLEVFKKQKQWKEGEIGEVLSDIDTEISRLTRMTEDLLFLESPTSQAASEELSVESILKEVVKKCTPTAKTKNLKITTKLEPFSAVLNKTDIEKVLFNLLHNAIKFSYPNKEVVVSLTSKGVIKIKDFGVGIPKKEISRIFDRFYKVDNARIFNTESSSGLGLSIVKKICDKNKWSFRIKSTIKKGTTVILDLGEF